MSEEMAAKDFAATRKKMDTPKGKGWIYNPLVLEERGYHTSTLPFSVKILLENALRNSGRVAGASEAAEALAEWPRGMGSELPFMPYRVLLQDYTGVPLVVDLAAMRDAATSAGVNPRLVNSKVPVDLIIDHSIQVDAWSSVDAFGTNLEREYERNSERYSLLKWAQTAFDGMRVFPPGKGICHQVNLEYLSRVVATLGKEDGLEAFPDTVLGTDSHTTMVNGLGVLGWGVGGIEAEAVMLGEPYHMPIPGVQGVELSGALSEGVTATDLVLSVTEKLREKNVVGKFVEFFGEGYRHLSVPDRATLGNMSPEYGATAGYCPVDDATLSYLLGTGRTSAQVDFVKRYTKETGLYLTRETARYSDVLVIELDRVEPSIAGPRNPEERRSLSRVPSFASALLAEYRNGARNPAPSAPPNQLRSKGQLLLQRSSNPSWDLNDGAIIIAAITSCTNTSNPTVMMGAGLLAKRAVELGIYPKPWVKTSLAPGSVVVTDYLQESGLLPYLEKLGFNVVGYGCTTCIAEGTPVLSADGTTRPIESMPEAGGALIFGPTSTGELKIARQSAQMKNGVRDCVRLVLQDGRSLICTQDHRILRSDGRWVRADELVLGKDRIVVGLEGPMDTPGTDEFGYTLHTGSLTFAMNTQHERSRTLAFARLLGHLLNDGSISVRGQGRMNVGQALDRETMLNDIELVAGRRPAANRYDERKWSIALPMSLTRGIMELRGVQAGRRVSQPPTLPEFLFQEDCPVALVREFLGGLFGADGQAPTLHRWGKREDDSTLEPPAYSQSTIPAYVGQAMELMQRIIGLLRKCGVETEGARLYSYPTRSSNSSYAPAQDGIPRVEVRLELPDGLSFVERVGFRYCVDKALRSSAAAVYWRLVRGIQEQRLWMPARLDELHKDEPDLSFSEARRMVAVSLLGREIEESLPPVVSPHFALLEAHDRFSRLPETAARGFGPLHRESRNFPSPAALFEELGVQEWFPSLRDRATRHLRKYCVEKQAMALPTFSLQVLDRRPAGRRLVFDLTVDGLHAFVAGTVAVHNCIGNSGPLDPDVEQEIKARDLYAVAVLSGNRNFDGRINPLAKGSFLMSPMHVVVYALAGRIDFDFGQTPLGVGKNGKEVYLRDIWPTMKEVEKLVERSLSPSLYLKRYAEAMEGDRRWNALASYSDDRYHWQDESTYVKRPPWFEPNQSLTGKADISGARILAVLGDKVTTDHISPAGTIAFESPAGGYLRAHGVELIQFSSYGSRRGNHEVMVRGGFANIRLRNAMAQGKEGGWTTHYPSNTQMTIYDAASRYTSEGVPTIIVAGKQYGAGSSRDWAAKAPKLLGVRAVIAESFERIHRSNLVAMGVLPLQFKADENASTLGLKGEEVVEITGISKMTGPGETLSVVATGASGQIRFNVLCRVDNRTETEYLEKGGILPYVFSRVHNSVH